MQMDRRLYFLISRYKEFSNQFSVHFLKQFSNRRS